MREAWVDQASGSTGSVARIGAQAIVGGASASELYAWMYLDTAQATSEGWDDEPERCIWKRVCVGASAGRDARGRTCGRAAQLSNMVGVRVGRMIWWKAWVDAGCGLAGGMARIGTQVDSKGGSAWAPYSCGVSSSGFACTVTPRRQLMSGDALSAPREWACQLNRLIDTVGLKRSWVRLERAYSLAMADACKSAKMRCVAHRAVVLLSKRDGSVAAGCSKVAGAGCWGRCRSGVEMPWVWVCRKGFGTRVHLHTLRVDGSVPFPRTPVAGFLERGRWCRPAPRETVCVRVSASMSVL